MYLIVIILLCNSQLCHFRSMTLLNTTKVNIRSTTDDDQLRILEFLRKHLFREEPLCKYLGVVSNEKPVCEALEKYCCEDKNHLSVVAELNGELIGVVMNTILERGIRDDSFFGNDQQFAKIARLLEHVAEKSDPFQYFPNDNKALYLKVISVDDTFKRKGVGTQLLIKSR